MTKREQKVFDDMINGINAEIVKKVTAGEAIEPTLMARADALNKINEALSEVNAKADTEETAEEEA